MKKGLETLQYAFINAFGTALYVMLVVLGISSLQSIVSSKDTVLAPIAALMLFVCSAGITGFLVFGRPVILYLDGKKKEALSLLGYTLAILFVITMIIFLLLIVFNPI